MSFCSSLQQFHPHKDKYVYHLKYKSHKYPQVAFCLLLQNMVINKTLELIFITF